jgi:hypothetical protein
LVVAFPASERRVRQEDRDDHEGQQQEQVAPRAYRETG